MAIPIDPFSQLLWNIGYSICHQIPARSFFEGGYQLPMCARDTGTYLGFLAVFAIFLVFRRQGKAQRPELLIIAAGAIGIGFYTLDGFASQLDLYETNNFLRLASGLMMGIGMGMFLLLALAVLLHQGEERTAAFSRGDLLLAYALGALVLLTFSAGDLGVPAYYVLSTLIIIGFLSLMFTISAVIVAAILPHAPGSKSTRKVVMLAILLEVIIISALWWAHGYVPTS
jgi:uncharacterized membrane protein